MSKPVETKGRILLGLMEATGKTLLLIGPMILLIISAKSGIYYPRMELVLAVVIVNTVTMALVLNKFPKVRNWLTRGL